MSFLSLQISYFSSGVLDSSDDSSENSSVNQLSYHQCSYSWFKKIRSSPNPINFIIITELGLQNLHHLVFWYTGVGIIPHFIIFLDVLISSSSSISICDLLLLQKWLLMFLSLHFGVYNQYLIAFILLVLIIG